MPQEIHVKVEIDYDRLAEAIAKAVRPIVTINNPYPDTAAEMVDRWRDEMKWQAAK